MEAWKKVLVAGSMGTSAVLLVKRKWPAGVLAAGVGLAVLASEYPEKFEDVRSALPDYFNSGMRWMAMISRAGEKITQLAERGGKGIWDEIQG
jgi:hypothetical protein